MALTLLQPGIQPAGQFDLADGLSPVGGECGTVAAQAGNSAADVYAGMLQVTMGEAAATGSGGSTVYHGLIDEGSTGYGTLFGNVIGGTVGQGTGFGVSSTVGVVVVGPNTATGSGKATLWDKPGLYGVDDNAFMAAGGDAGALNDNVYGNVAATTALGSDGELWSDTGDGDGAGTGGAAAALTGSAVGIFLGAVNDSSLVSTTTFAATAAATAETNAVYLLGTR
jgi:hypothetical protein